MPYVNNGGYSLSTLIYLVRHGETQWNRDARIQGQLDIPLNEEGIKQARLLAKRFVKVDLDAIYASDLSRAINTAEIVAGVKGLSVEAAPQFREIDFGLWQGMTWQEIDKEYPESRRQMEISPETAHPPKGESWSDVADRVFKGLDDIAGKWPEGNVMVVSHGGSSRMAICRILDISLAKRWKLRMDNTSISILEYRNGDWLVRCFNDVSHLDGELVDDVG
jgi:alpha-ribazole phosphatase